MQFHYKLSSNKHIVQLYGMEQDELAYYLFMEYCDSDLGKLLQNRGTVFETQESSRKKTPLTSFGSFAEATTASTATTPPIAT